MTRAVVVMGVSASGKSTLGAALAQALGVPFCEGDDLHPPANVAKMKGGIPLTDDDRRPWLDRIGAWLTAQGEAGGVASCSALRRVYRDRLRAARPDLAFVLADVDRETLARRIAHRPGHFMPPALLASQIDTLERPTADERALVLDATEPTGHAVAAACRWLERIDDQP